MLAIQDRDKKAKKADGMSGLAQAINSTNAQSALVLSVSGKKVLALRTADDGAAFLDGMFDMAFQGDINASNSTLDLNVELDTFVSAVINRDAATVDTFQKAYLQMFGDHKHRAHNMLVHSQLERVATAAAIKAEREHEKHNANKLRAEAAKISFLEHKSEEETDPQSILEKKLYGDAVRKDSARRKVAADELRKGSTQRQKVEKKIWKSEKNKAEAVLKEAAGSAKDDVDPEKEQDAKKAGKLMKNLKRQESVNAAKNVFSSFLDDKGQTEKQQTRLKALAAVNSDAQLEYTINNLRKMRKEPDPGYLFLLMDDK